MDSFTHAPQISFRGIQRSTRILHSIWRYYFPIYDLTHSDYFQSCPALIYVSAQVYQADEKLEASQTRMADYSAIQGWLESKASIEGLLKELGILTPEIEQELNHGTEYFSLEDRMIYQGIVTYTDLKRAMELRSFDFRVLHNAFLLLLNKPITRPFFDLIFPLEVIAELQSDLTQYQEDVAEGKFNTYRMLVKLYQTDAPVYLQREFGHYRTMFEQRLASLPPASQEKFTGIVRNFDRDFPIPDFPDPVLE